MKKFLKFFILVVVLVSLSVGAKQGCTTTEKVAGSTGIAAAFGAGIGALTGNPGLGAAIGAGTGFLGGVIWAASSDDKSVEDVEKLKKLSGIEMNADKLNEKLADVGVSSETKNAIMADVNLIARKFPTATFMINMHGQVQRYS